MLLKAAAGRQVHPWVSAPYSVCSELTHWWNIVLKSITDMPDTEVSVFRHHMGWWCRLNKSLTYRLNKRGCWDNSNRKGEETDTQHEAAALCAVKIETAPMATLLLPVLLRFKLTRCGPAVQLPLLRQSCVAYTLWWRHCKGNTMWDTRPGLPSSITDLSAWDAATEA